MKEAIQKECGLCKIVFLKDKRLSSKQWANRKFCSAICQRSGRNRVSMKGRKFGDRANPRKCD